MRQQCISSLMASSSLFPLFALDAACPTYLFPRGKSSARHQDGITHPSIERKHYITLHLKISRAISSPTPFYIFHFTLYTSLFPRHLLHFLPVSSFGNNQNNFFLMPRTGPCGTTLATAFGSDLRSVDTLRSSRFALTQPDRFVTGVFPRGAFETAGAYPPLAGIRAPWEDAPAPHLP